MGEILNNLNNNDLLKRDTIIKKILDNWISKNILELTDDEISTEIRNLILFKFKDKFNISIENIVANILLKYIEKNYKNITMLTLYIGPYHVLRTGCNDIELSIKLKDVYEGKTKIKSTTKLILDVTVKEYNLTKSGINHGSFKFMLMKKGKYYKISNYKEERKINE